MTRLATVLTRNDLPSAELHAMRLDGELFAIDEAFAPIDIPETPGSTDALGESFSPRDSSATIPGCDVVEAPDGRAVAFYQALEESYDNPRYPWFSGRKATALSDALAAALPAGTDIEFPSAGTSAFGTESALRFGPVQFLFGTSHPQLPAAHPQLACF